MNARLARALLPVAVAAGLVLGAPRGEAGDDQKPLPVDRTQILKPDSGTFYVEGRVRIGKTTDIAVRVKRFRLRSKDSPAPAIQNEARHAAVAAAAGKRLGAHARPAAHGPTTAGSAQAHPKTIAITSAAIASTEVAASASTWT